MIAGKIISASSIMSSRIKKFMADFYLDDRKVKEMSRNPKMKKEIEKYENNLLKLQNHLISRDRKNVEVKPHSNFAPFKSILRFKTKFNVLSADIKRVKFGNSLVDKVDILIPTHKFKHINSDSIKNTLAMPFQTELKKNLEMDIKNLTQAKLIGKARKFLEDSLKEFKAFNTRLFRYFDLRGNGQKLSTDSTPYVSVYNAVDIEKALKVFDSIPIDLEKILDDMGKYDGDLYGYFFVVGAKKILPGGSSYIKRKFNAKEGIVNPQNKDNECFKACCKIHQLKKIGSKAYRPSVFNKVEDKYNYENVNFPASLNDIMEFEKNNKIAVAIFKLRGESSKFDILYHGNFEYKNNDLINLLLLEEEGNTHYCYIKDISKKLNNNSKSNNIEKKDCEWCKYCFKMVNKKVWEKHLNGCIQYKKYHEENLVFPDEENKFVKFDTKMRKYQYFNEFIILADFEASNKPLFDCKKGDTELITNHVVNSYNYIVIDRIKKEIYKKVLYRAENDEEDVVTKFLFEMEKVGDDLKELRSAKKKDYSNIKDIRVNKNREYECYLCKSKVSGKKIHKDHSHYTGEFRGFACADCNMHFKPMDAIPCYFHNLKSYDGQFIISKFHKAFSGDKYSIHVIQQNSEKILSMTMAKIKHYKDKQGEWHQKNDKLIKFMDSCQHLPMSLEELADNLTLADETNEERNKRTDEGRKPERDYEKCRFMKEVFPNDVETLCKKGIYDYEYVDSVEKFKMGLPQKEEFLNRHMSKHNEEDYETMKKVYEKFGCKNYGEYHDIYLWTDTLMLCDVFQNYSEIAYRIYGLDPSWFISSPALSWHSMLKTMDDEFKKGNIETDKIELVTDYEVYKMFQKQKKGGFSFIGKRLEEANNEYMLGYYDETKEKRYIVYLDANNLYSCGMVKKLPYGNFRFVEMCHEEIMKLNDESKEGCVIECDIEFPDEIHDKLKQFVPAPEIMKVNSEWLRPYQKEVGVGKIHSEKLIAHLYKHENYVLNYRNYQILFNLGCVLTIKKVLKFSQCEFMKAYVDINTRMRSLAKSEFEKTFYKLMNNSVYGKTMQSNLLKKDIRLTDDENTLLKWRSFGTLKYVWHDDTYFNGVHIVEMQKKEHIINSPEYIGFQVMDISKCVMYDFHYNVMQKFDPDIEVCMSDTDSLVYSSKKDLYKFMDENRQHFDLSDSKFVFPDGRELNDKTNEKVIGKFKAEFKNRVIMSHCGNVAKSYSMNYLKTKKEIEKEEEERKKEEKKIEEEKNEEKKLKMKNKLKPLKNKVNEKKLKGAPKVNVKNDITHEDYVDCVNEGKIKSLDNCFSIRSIHHQLYLVKSKKVVLHPYYDKMYLKDKINCVPYGHYSIRP